MGRMLTVAALMLVCIVVAVKIVAANRRAALARRRAEEEKALREERENELRGRLERVKKQRDDLGLAKRAIEDDPARAAKTLGRMMRQKSDKT